MSDLIERLRDRTWGKNITDTLAKWADARVEAADRIAELEAENARLREDAKALIESEPVATCESCGAWLLDSDDFASDLDGNSGCWAKMTDGAAGKTKPCYSYRAARAALKETSHDD